MRFVNAPYDIQQVFFRLDGITVRYMSVDHDVFLFG